MKYVVCFAANASLLWWTVRQTVKMINFWRKSLQIMASDIKVQLQLMGGAEFWLDCVQPGGLVTNFRISQLNSTLKYVFENILGEKKAMQ